MKKNCFYLAILLLVMACSSNLDVNGQKKVLFLGRGTLGTHAADQDLYDKLVNWGYNVDYIEALPATVADYSGYIGIFINETIGSGTVTNFGKEHNYPIPCVCLEGWAVLANRWGGWVNDESGTDPKTDWDQHNVEGSDGQYIVITDNNHYITFGFPKNVPVQWANSTVQNTIDNTNPVSFKEVNRNYSAKLAQCQSFQETGFYTMVTVDSNEAGFPNRVFLWGLVSYAVEGGDPYTEHAATDEYFNIIERACEWAFKGKKLASGTEDVSAQDEGFAVFPSPASGILNVRYFLNNTNSYVKASLTGISGQEMKVITPDQSLAGYNFITFDTQDLPQGIYFVNLQIDDKFRTEKIVVE